MSKGKAKVISAALYEEIPFKDLGTLFEYLPPDQAIAIYGPPGIGKTALINSHPDLQPVEQIGLAIRQVEDIGGLPMPDKDKGVTDIFPLRWFVRFCLRKEEIETCAGCQMFGTPEYDLKRKVLTCSNPECGYEKLLPTGTIFFDEFDKGSPEKQVAVMRILSERSLEGYVLSPLVRIIVASNREQDMAGVWNEMPNVIKNRLIHIGVFPTFEQWEQDFATPHGVHPLIITFLDRNTNKLVEFDPSTPAYGFATPRTWEKAGSILDGIERGMPNKLAFKALVGTIGAAMANEFWDFKAYVDKCPPLAELANGTKDYPPKGEPALWVALVARCVAASEQDLKQESPKIRTLQMVCTILANMPDHARNFQVMLGTWLRKRPATKDLFLDAQAMGTDAHLKALGALVQDLKKPKNTKKNSWGA